MNNFTKITKVCILNSGCVIIELDNGILFYYYLQKGFYDIISVNNLKWMMSGIMNSKVYIYTNLNKLHKFQAKKLEQVNLNFLQQSNNKLISLVALNSFVNALVTENNKIYMKVLRDVYGFNKSITKNFEYRETEFYLQNLMKAYCFNKNLTHDIELIVKYH